MRVTMMVAVLAAGPASAGFVVTFEAPGVASADPRRFAPGTVLGVENFDARPTGGATGFVTDYGTGGRITGAYTGVDVRDAGQYGGAGGAGRYAETFGAYDVRFATAGLPGVNSFGYWLSALDRGNVADFYRDDALLFSFGPSDFVDLVAGCPSAYCGNPFAPFLGRNVGEPYAFLNFRMTEGVFDRIRFHQTRGGGYESDNHTVAYVPESDDAVPAPATWALLGLGAALLTARRRA